MTVNGVGKKVKLSQMQKPDSKEFKGGLRIDKFGEGVTEKDKALFAAIDSNKDGILTQDELSVFFGASEQQKALDKNEDGTVTRREAKKFIKYNEKLKDLQINKKELLEFLHKAGQASEDIKSCTLNDQGEIVITYQDNSTDTISTDGTRVNQSTNDVGDNVTTTFNPSGKKVSEAVTGIVAGQNDECTTTTLYESDGETVKNITITDSQGRIVKKSEGNTVINTGYDDENGIIYENTSIDGKLVSTTIKDTANNKTTTIEYDSETGEDEAQLQKTRTEIVGDETKTWTFTNGKKSTLSIKKGTSTTYYEYDEAGTTAEIKYIDTNKGNGIIERKTFSKQNGTNVTTSSIDGVNQSQSSYNDDWQITRTIQYTEAPNGERATVIVIQDQETIDDICNRFGMTQEEFSEFNKGNKDGLRGVTGTQVNVKDELEVTDSRFDGRLSSEDAIKAKNKRIYKEKVAEAQQIANQRQEVVMLIAKDKNYNGSWKNVARDLYQQEGITNYSEIDLEVRAKQLEKLNPQVTKFVYGETVIKVKIDPDAFEYNDNVRKLNDGSDATGVFVMARGGVTHAWNIALRACQQSENNVARPLTPIQQGIRTQKIIELNPGVFDKTGKMINPPADGKIKIPVGYTEKYQQKQAQKHAKFENQYYAAAAKIYQTADKQIGMNSVETMKKQMRSITPEHIVQFYESYNTLLERGKAHDTDWAKSHGATVRDTSFGSYRYEIIATYGTNDTSIYDTICSETGMGTDEGKKQRKRLCTDIFERIATAAQQAGVAPGDIETARNKFTNSMNAQFNASGTVNTTQMEQATEWLIGKIHEAKTAAPTIDVETAQNAFTDMYQQHVEGAQASFDQNMEHITWVGTFSAWCADLVVDNTTVGQMEEKLGIAKGSLDRLKNCESKEAFNSTYEEIFGVPFNEQNISTIMEYQKKLGAIANNEAEIKTINYTYKVATSQNSLSALEDWATAGIEDENEKELILKTIYEEFGGTDDISKLSEAAKMNAIRKAKNAEIAVIEAEIKNLKGSKTTEQMYEDMVLLSTAAFGPNNNIAKTVEKFNGNINTAEMAGTIVTEIGATLIPVGRVLSLLGKGVRLVNRAYKGYKAGKTIQKATTAVRATNATRATTTAVRTTEALADATVAGESSATVRFVTNVKNKAVIAMQDPVTRQSMKAGFNSGVLDYTKYGDVEHAVEHGLETATFFEVGGAASRFSQTIAREMEVTSTLGRWGIEAGITGTADLTASYLDTKLVHGLDLTTEEGIMTFSMDAAFALLGARGTRPKPQGHTSVHTEATVLNTATNGGTSLTGGTFGEPKFQRALDEAHNVTPEAAPEMYHQATQHQATNRQQGHALQNEVLEVMGIRREGKKLIADTHDGQVVVKRVKEQLGQDASNILNASKGGELPPHDAATLDAHLANNCNTKEEVEQFIKDLKKRVGTDANGNLNSYTAADGTDHGALVLKNAERKLKTLGNFDDALSTIPAEGGMADLATVRAFMGSADATSEQLQALLDAMQSNPAIKKSQGARKLMSDLEAQIEVNKQKSAIDTANAFKTDEPKVKNETNTEAKHEPVVPTQKKDVVPEGEPARNNNVTAENLMFEPLTNETDISKRIKTLYPDISEQELQEIYHTVDILKNEKNLKFSDVLNGDIDLNTTSINNIASKIDNSKMTYNEFKQTISEGRQITKMSDSELTSYYKKLVPYINDEELGCLIDQVHRIKKGEPRYLGTQREKELLESIYCKQWFGLRLNGIKPNRGFKTSEQFPKADIEFVEKNLTWSQENSLRHWIDDGKNWALENGTFDELSEALQEDTYLYRGVSNRFGGNYQVQTKFLNTIHEGAIIDNSNKFISTSKGVEYGSGYRNENFTAGTSYVLKIKVPKGTKVLDMRLEDKNFDEITLQPHKLKVVSIDYNSGVVECEYIPVKSATETPTRPKIDVNGTSNDALKTILTEDGITDLASVRAFMGSADATSEQLQALLNAMESNPAIKKSQGARKLMSDLKAQIEMRKSASVKNINESAQAKQAKAAEGTAQHHEDSAPELKQEEVKSTEHRTQQTSDGAAVKANDSDAVNRKLLSTLKKSDGTPKYSEQELKELLSLAKVEIPESSLYALLSGGNYPVSELKNIFKHLKSSEDVRILDILTDAKRIAADSNGSVIAAQNELDIYSIYKILEHKHNSNITNFDKFISELLDNGCTGAKPLDLTQLGADGPLSVMDVMYQVKNDSQKETFLAAVKYLHAHPEIDIPMNRFTEPLADLDLKLDTDLKLEAYAMLMKTEGRIGNVGIHDILPLINTQADLNNLKSLLNIRGLGTKPIIDALKKGTVNPEQLRSQAHYSYPRFLIDKEKVQKLCNDFGIKPEYAENLVMLSDINPHRYNKLIDSGLLELIKTGKIDESILKNIDENTFLSNRTLKDIRKIRDGQSPVTKLNSEAELANISKFVEDGDVCEVAGKLYVNNNGKAEAINLSKEKFEQLFPLLTRFSFEQKGLGNCWFVSTVDNIMDAPAGRVSVYKMFKQDGNDIIIEFPGGKDAVRFKDGKVLDANGYQIGNTQGSSTESSAVGILMLEQAATVHRLRANAHGYNPETATITEISEFASNYTDVPTMMEKGSNGWQGKALEEILGINKIDGSSRTTPKGILDIRQDIINNINQENKLVYMATRGDLNTRIEGVLSSEYDLYAGHAYSIKGYNPETDMVYITNPWHTSVVTEVPMHELLKYIDNVNVVTLRE